MHFALLAFLLARTTVHAGAKCQKNPIQEMNPEATILWQNEWAQAGRHKNGEFGKKNSKPTYASFIYCICVLFVSSLFSFLCDLSSFFFIAVLFERCVQEQRACYKTDGQKPSDYKMGGLYGFVTFRRNAFFVCFLLECFLLECLFFGVVVQPSFKKIKKISFIYFFDFFEFPESQFGDFNFYWISWNFWIQKIQKKNIL